ncbi:Na+/H+ antiporter subunit E [Halopseudomonas salegens]|uniref:Multicomponent Na+:H+ antiporter subunit E n=1 Tax=Halopseudomonas salegens TaxID=1434072 RepID=A0A1H2E6G1_9GAMM|nr:Na+/H+ antiporter subunit E [Halopseudomonas salegens]SDT90625.1 multicomponent Na+:H+ antiporter subunit E [Halopseudomonas salegens]
MTLAAEPRPPFSLKLRNSPFWLLLHATLWILLSGGSGWYLGLPVIAAATLLSCWLQATPWYLRLTRLPSLLVFFLTELLLGGWDVARRALHPRLPVDPAWVRHELQSTNPQVHLLLSAIVGLMPGTLSSRFSDGYLQLHVLDQQQPWQKTVARMEDLLAAMLPEVSSR